MTKWPQSAFPKKIVSNNFGIYIHIPYCLQRCTYCDFATYVHTEILPSEEYLDLLKKEILNRQHLFKDNQSSLALNTLYFGGGTPSLLPASQISGLISLLNQNGFITNENTEITIEINPATVDEKKLNVYLGAGVNRFSVGAQTFSDRLLKMVHREHNSQQTLETLKLLSAYKLNYSFDLLFALPTQTLSELQYDLDLAIDLGMKHLSPYCLTVPEGHPLSKNRPLDTDQLEMFEMIHQALGQKGFERYEISNYALPGYESKHNLLYWTDEPYWGIGLSAHSYHAQLSDWGTRFWNPSNINIYQKQIQSEIFNLQQENSEHLLKYQSLTDFCHTSLRLMKGISREKLSLKFGPDCVKKVEKIAEDLIKNCFIEYTDNHWFLTTKGIYISNQIFEKFTFLDSDFAH